jgi:hypothetical protein
VLVVAGAVGRGDLQKDQLGGEPLGQVGGPPDRVAGALALIGGDQDLSDQG